MSEALPRSCPSCLSIGLPRDGCDDPWHVNVTEAEVMAGDDPELNPRCRAYCRQGGVKGHPAVAPAEMLAMGLAAISMGIPCGGRGELQGPEHLVQLVMRELYRSGHGYHAIADLAGREHQEVAELLMLDFPGERQGKWTGS